jgi:hypothetical protein
MRRVATIVILLLLVLFGGYTALWFFVADQIEREISRWAEARPEKFAVSWDTLGVGGYPLAFRVEAGGLRVRDLTPGRTIEFRAPDLTASAHPWNFRLWQIAAPAGLTATAGPADAPAAKLTAQTAAGEIVLKAERGIDIALDLARPVFDAGDRVAARRAAISAWVPEHPPQTHTEPALGLAVKARDLELPKLAALFRGPVEELAFDLRVLGPVPDLPPRQAAKIWRDAGGTIELEKIAVHWGDLAAAGSGTLALDSEMQPEAAFSGSLQGYDALMTRLSEAGLLPSGGIVFARLGLSLLAKPGPNGRPQIPTSFTLQNGEMSLGPINLGRVPRLDW